MEASHVFRTGWGWMGIRATPRGVASIILPKASRRAVESALARDALAVDRHTSTTPKASRQHNPKEVLARSQKQIVKFLAGRRQDLDFPIDLSGRLPFQRKVWLAARRIPYGRARSYQWVAVRIGSDRHARAVGLALGANPVPLVVPCHRVVAHDGSLGGFSGGLQTKRRLLKLEGTLRHLKGKGQRQVASGKR